jgi:hypothetical protein
VVALALGLCDPYDELRNTAVPTVDPVLISEQSQPTRSHSAKGGLDVQSIWGQKSPVPAVGHREFLRGTCIPFGRKQLPKGWRKERGS